jgi:hypothetical protein
VTKPEFTVPYFSPMGYKEFLITVAGIAGTLLILSVFAIKLAIVNRIKKDFYFGRFALSIYETGLLTLLLLLPLLVFPFSERGAIIIGVMEFGCGVVFGVYGIPKYILKR